MHDVAVRASRSGSVHVDRRVLVVALLIGPALSLLLLRASINTAGADPSFYLGYVLDLTTHIERFGQTYHGNRISYLLVDIPFFAVLPPRVAFYASRYVMLAVAVFAVFCIGRRFGGDTVGLLTAATLVFVPWLPRQLLWMHYDGFATAYLLVALALLLTPVTPNTRRIGEVLAGVAAALAVNANLVLLLVIAAFLPSFWILRSEDTVALRARSAARISAGFVAASGAVGFVLNRLYPGGEAFPELVALRVGLDVLASDTWFVPLGALGWTVGYLVVVPLTAGALAAALLSTRSPRVDAEDHGRGEWYPLAQAALLHLALMATFALVLHFRFANTWLSASYYTIYHLPGVVLGVVALLSRWADGVDARGQAIAGAGAVILLGVSYALLPLPGSLAIPSILIAIGGGLGVLLAMRSSGATLAGWVPLMVALTFLGFAASPWHAGTQGHVGDLAARERLEWDVFDHSVALKGLVEDVTRTDERVVFWHTNEGVEGEWLKRLNMVFYGTGEGRLHAKTNPVGMPVLTDGERATIMDERPLVVILMAADVTALSAGKVELLLAGVDVRERTQLVLEGDVIDVHIAVMEIP